MKGLACAISMLWMAGCTFHSTISNFDEYKEVPMVTHVDFFISPAVLTMVKHGQILYRSMIRLIVMAIKLATHPYK
jgi:hypothetical protein